MVTKITIVITEDIPNVDLRERVLPCIDTKQLKI